MLTPIFELSQDDKFVKAVIYAPFAKVSETEIEFVGSEVLFSSNPYFLHLYLPDEVIESGEEAASYDADTKKFTINIPKKEIGKYFPGLDMVTKLLTPPGKSSAKKAVEEIGSDDDDEMQYLAEQVLPSTSSVISINTETHGYGFANRRRDVFSTLRDELSEIVDIKCVDQMSIADRRKMAFEMEAEKFSDDHYLADYYAEDEVKSIMELKCFASPESSVVVFTSEERDRLKDLPKNRIVLSQRESSLAMNSLVDIIFAYAYDVRTTFGEHSVESGWTVSKLSSTLSCMVSWDEVKDAIVACVRRSLCYPLYRNWLLAMRVLNDVHSIFREGRSLILKCLLDIHRIFANDSDYRYIFNDLYVTDYCVWIQNVDDSLIAAYADCIKSVSSTINKAEVRFNLEEIELAASLAMLDVSSAANEEKAESKNQLDSDDDDVSGKDST